MQKYRKTNAICATCGKPGHRTDVCPAPVPENERRALCGKTGVDASQRHECHPRGVLCGGPHVAGCRDCPRRYRQPAPSKPANLPAGQTRGRSRTPTRHHNGQRDITRVAGKETRERSASWSRSGNRAGSPSRSRSRSRGRRSWSRSSGRRPAQQHTRQGQTTTTPPVLKLTGPQMQSIIAKHNRQVTQLNEGKHFKGVKLLSGRRGRQQAITTTRMAAGYHHSPVATYMHPVHQENSRAARAKAYDKYSDHAGAFFVDAAGPLHNRSTATIVHRGQMVDCISATGLDITAMEEAEVKSATSHTQYCNRLRPIVKRVSGNSYFGYQGTREFEAMRLMMPPPENFSTGAPPIPPQHNFSLTRTILSPFFHILKSYNTSG
ncbi:hypothetical protein HPB49_022420 [Dermacentor silvarum]|uniref:Uncharacterized protein n=1 Tax=Dermacentor silvarum TaxID=543639 RepID=A0ACB8E3N7_DERSI|nr:hypothetical protein HPB49_022420 [Dermacentor silvarum]